MTAFEFRKVPDRDPGLVRERFLRFVTLNPEVSDRFTEGGAAVSLGHSADVLKDGSLRPECLKLVL